MPDTFLPASSPLKFSMAPRKSEPQTTSCETINVSIIEPFALMSGALRMLVDTGSAMSVVSEHTNCAQFLELRGVVPHVLILHPLDDDPELETLIAKLPDLPTKVLVLTDNASIEKHLKLITRGVRGLVHKDRAGDTLLRAIQCIASGEVWLERGHLTSFVSQASARLSAPLPDSFEARYRALSPREKEIVRLLLEGLPNKQIAARMFLSETTIRHYFTAIFRKTEMKNRQELLVHAMKLRSHD